MIESHINVELFRVSSSNIKNHCYLVYKNGKGLLVDPAWEFDKISSFLNDNGIVLQGVLLTHSHPDHTDLASRFTEQYNCPAYMSVIEIEYYGFSCTNLRGIENEGKFDIGNFTIDPIFTPGHTLGGTCYLVHGNLFSGDTLFIEGVGICEGKGSDVDQMFDSIQKLKRLLRPDVLVWPGHSFGQTSGKLVSYLLKNNIYYQLNDRKQFVDFRMRKNRPNPFVFR